MKKLFLISILTAFVAVTILVSISSMTFAKESTKEEMVTCPVSGKTLPKSKAVSYTYKGKTYYFCCNHCLEEFKKNPEKYIKGENMVICPACGREMKKSEATPYKYKGKTYYFCGQSCINEFKKDPEKHLKEYKMRKMHHHKCMEDMKIKDPVCGMEINKENAKKLTYKGKTYYFCSDSCMNKFKKNPKKYEKKMADMVVCPACGREMKKSEATPYKYKGKTYYFCGQGCIEEFKKNPEKYLKEYKSGMGMHHHMEMMSE